MTFHLHVVAFMAFERRRIFDGPGLLIVVGDKGDEVTVDMGETEVSGCGHRIILGPR